MRLSFWSTIVLVTYSSAQSNAPFGSDGGAFVGITPGSTFAWLPCKPPASAQGRGNYNFECARLSVPIDHLNTATDKRTISIAVNRVRASNSKNYQGPLFMNPGGPGDSGTDFLFKNAASLISQVGDNYDIVSWDPRGVGSSLPALSCFADPASRAEALQEGEHIYLYNSNDTLAQLATLQQTIATGCQQESGVFLPYVGTMANVRDLNLMNRLYGFSNDLTYLGYSYGSILGSAYAATYPNNVRRIAVDGVLHVNRWFFDQQFFLTSYIDSDKVLDDFFHLCYLAGLNGCRFWHASEAEIRQAFITIDDAIHKTPARVGPTRQMDWSQFRLYIWNALKSPYKSWSGAGGLDLFLALLEKDKLSALTAPSADALLQYIAQGNHELVSNDTLVDPATGLRNGGENSDVIGAVDNPYSFTDIETLVPFLNSPQVTGTGYLVQSILATRGILNNYLKLLTPPDRPQAPFPKTPTSHPLLFLSNLRDPITPLQDALNVSSLFPSSVVLRANISGHAISSAPCKCAERAVLAYFADGTVPEQGTLCQPDVLPFGVGAIGEV
ncbi:MAG: hypothetical protein LQ338_001244 [Usnochroma carphineum]|nr:MAG: hypothetical protein LQ338_001244 [Usnochroma carphineum]